MYDLIDMEWNGYELRGCWTHYIILNFDLTHDFDLRFRVDIFKILYLGNGCND